MMGCLYAPRRPVPPAGSARYRARYRLRGVALHVDEEWPAGATANPRAYLIIKTPLSPIRPNPLGRRIRSRRSNVSGWPSHTISG